MCGCQSTAFLVVSCRLFSRSVSVGSVGNVGRAQRRSTGWEAELPPKSLLLLSIVRKMGKSGVVPSGETIGKRTNGRREGNRRQNLLVVRGATERNLEGSKTDIGGEFERGPFLRSGSGEVLAWEP